MRSNVSCARCCVFAALACAAALPARCGDPVPVEAAAAVTDDVYGYYWLSATGSQTNNYNASEIKFYPGNGTGWPISRLGFRFDLGALEDGWQVLDGRLAVYEYVHFHDATYSPESKWMRVTVRQASAAWSETNATYNSLVGISATATEVAATEWFSAAVPSPGYSYPSRWLFAPVPAATVDAWRGGANHGLVIVRDTADNRTTFRFRDYENYAKDTYAARLILSLAASNAVCFNASADAMIAEATPTDARVDSYRLPLVPDGNTGAAQRLLLKFDLSAYIRRQGYPGRVELRLFVNDAEAGASGSEPVSLVPCGVTENWNETDLAPTWNTHADACGPAIGPAFTLAATNKGHYVSTPIDPGVVCGWIDGSIPNHGILLRSADGAGVLLPVFPSADESVGAQLVCYPSRRGTVLCLR